MPSSKSIFAQFVSPRSLKKFLILIIATLLLSFFSWSLLPTISTIAAPPKVFEQAWKTINDNFFDPNFNGVNWKAMREKYATQAAVAQSPEELSGVINQMLAELNTSHTRFYTPEETAYYQLLGIFQPRSRELQKLPKSIFPRGKLEYSGIGIFTQNTTGKTFVSGVMEGSPGAQAGLQTGDELISADGRPFHPVDSFKDKASQPVKLVIQKTADPKTQKELTVTPKLLDPLTMFLDVQKASTQVLQQGGKKIGYVHLWSYAGDQYQEQLEEDLIYGKLRDADGLLLDLRGGWGGAPLTALNIYTARGPSLTSIPRSRDRYTIRAHWNKPVVMLVNEGSRSAKEILAYGFQQYKIGTVVGAKTPGAVVAGRAFLMEDGNLLYCAVSDVYLDGNQRLEGKGVTPDIEVPFTVEYAQGADPQKDRAIAVLLQQIQQR
ncbi:MAG: PDZ domain-containing protein [Oscillatoriales cyanobacterium C42_A2020_001]|nr:PDZ domain-containing protein [Leptolyngbyaceae cyanobacterium C42_A2020_001]